MCGIIASYGEKLPRKLLQKGFDRISHRGPDQSTLKEKGGLTLGFQRLAIMDLSSKGDQPFFDTNNSHMLICNGEIYNHSSLRKEVPQHKFQSNSDCEVLLPLLKKWGILKTLQNLDGVFALAFYDAEADKLLAARDPVGIRPLFYGFTKGKGNIVFASEVKAIHEICADIFPFPPGHYYDGDGSFIPFDDIQKKPNIYLKCKSTALEKIESLLTAGVAKRMASDAPVGYLLSGGLDSSLVCSIASKLSDGPIRTFAIGTNTDAIDTKYADIVAKHIGSEHTTVQFSTRDAITALDEVIYHLETWDITTIRASIGMYLLAQYIKENTNIKVLLTGEISDELFGYKYTDFAPSPEAFQEEAAKRLSEIHIYDVLRADRCISAHSLEARVPFGDLAFARNVMGIDPSLKMNTSGMGKRLLREAFASGDYLPAKILYREKAAFSDAVGHSMVDEIKDYAAGLYSDNDLVAAKTKYPKNTPFTKESLLYRDIFESHYPNRQGLIDRFWMPNKLWKNCNVSDPSARALPNYGNSGI